MGSDFGASYFFNADNRRTQMMQIARLVILCTIVVMAVNGMVTLDLTGNKKATSDNRFGSDMSYPALNDISGDYMIANHYDYFSPSSTGFSIYKWDVANNEYNSVLNYSLVVNSHHPITNGKWFAMFSPKTDKILLFQLDADNQMKDLTYLVAEAGFISTYFLLSDDSLIFPSYTGVYTYMYNGSAWNVVDSLEVNVQYTNFGKNGLLVDVSDTHMLVWNSSTSFNIYERSGLQWNLLETHNIEPKYAPSFDGGLTSFMIDRNTVVISVFALGDPNLGNVLGSGYIAVFSKTGSNGLWQDQVIPAEDFNLPPYSYLGLVSFVIDSNNILLGAPNAGAGIQAKRSLENFDEFSKKSVQGSETGSYGAAFLLQRNSETNQWSAAAQFVVDKKINNYFGTGFGKNGYGDIMIMSCEMDNSVVSYYHCLPYSFPKCIVDPINVTCNDVALNDCSSVDLNNLGLYTQNDVQCGAVDASFQNIGYQDNKFTATLAFSRTLAPSSYSCNVTASCPLPPISAPVAGSVPVATPGKKVSSAMDRSLTAVSLVATLIGVLLM